jgi:uncharacterized protein YbcI
MSASETQEHPSPAVPILAQLSNEMVRVYKEQFGRGPTLARSAWCTDDMLIVVLENTLTLAERNLVRLGEHGRVRELRTFFQYANVREFCEPVERLTGRTVRSFVSGIDTYVDGLSLETFVLYPAGAEGETSRIELGAT